MHFQPAIGSPDGGHGRTCDMEGKYQGQRGSCQGDQLSTNVGDRAPNETKVALPELLFCSMHQTLYRGCDIVPKPPCCSRWNHDTKDDRSQCPQPDADRKDRQIPGHKRPRAAGHGFSNLRCSMTMRLTRNRMSRGYRYGRPSQHVRSNTISYPASSANKVAKYWRISG